MVVMWGEKIIRHTTQRIQNFIKIHVYVNDNITKENGMNGYICMFLGKRAEVMANDLWQAKQKAISVLNVPKSKQGLLSIVLAEVEGNQITHRGEIA